MNRARAVLRSTTLWAFVLAGFACGREVLTPTANDTATAVFVPRAHDGDGSFSGSVPVDATNASGGIDLNTFADWTLVDITVSGLLTQHQNTLGTDLQFGPMGLPNCTAGYTITYGGALAVLFPCPSGGAPEPSVTAGAVVRGAGRADRSNGPTICSGFPIPCFTYSGSQTITVTPVPVTVSVRGDFTQAPAGSTITFTSTIVPANLSFGGWWFFMDNGFTYQACPSSNRNTRNAALWPRPHGDVRERGADGARGHVARGRRAADSDGYGWRIGRWWRRWWWRWWRWRRSAVAATELHTTDSRTHAECGVPSSHERWQFIQS